MNHKPVAVIYDFDDAPLEYKQLSTHGGDEDWVIVMPKDTALPFPMYYLESGSDYADGWGHIDAHELEDGTKVIILAHA